MYQVELQKRLDQTLPLAIKAGKLLARMFGMPPEKLRMEFQATAGMTPRTIIDTQIGGLIHSTLRSEFPDDHIIEEESGYDAGRNGWRWFVDPFDGTSNVIAQLPQSVVGIAATFEGIPAIGIVMNPFSEEITYASNGGGAFRSALDYGESRDCLWERLHVATDRPVSSRFVAVDALWNANTAMCKARFMERLAAHAQNIRCSGSNSLDASHVAQGRFDAWMMDAVGGPWDIAPAIIIIEEAGGKVTDIQGNTPKLDGTCPLVLGSNGEFHNTLLTILQDCYADYDEFL